MSTPASRRRRPWLVLFALGGALLAALALTWGLQEWRWRTPLYCIAQPGTVWKGAAPRPAALEPRCPQSASYRREVRSGLSRVEQYHVSGWQPRAVADLLHAAGYRLIEDELVGQGHYSAFMGRVVATELQYTAVRDGDGTLITISGH